MNIHMLKLENYSYQYQYYAEFLDKELGRKATDKEITEYMAEQEMRAMDALEGE